MDKLVGSYELAKLEKVSHTTIYNWVSKGMPYHTQRRGLKQVKKFSPSEVKAWLRGKEVTVECHTT